MRLKIGPVCARVYRVRPRYLGHTPAIELAVVWSAARGHYFQLVRSRHIDIAHLQATGEKKRLDHLSYNHGRMIGVQGEDRWPA